MYLGVQNIHVYLNVNQFLETPNCLLKLVQNLPTSYSTLLCTVLDFLFMNGCLYVYRPVYICVALKIIS